MIRFFDRKLRKLVFILFMILLVCITSIVNLSIYNAGVNREKKQLRELSIDIGLENMVNPSFVKKELQGMVFASVQIPRMGDVSFAPNVCVNQITGVADEKLVEYANRVQADIREEIRLPGMLYIVKRKKEVGKVLLFFPKKTVWKQCLPVLAACLSVEAVILLLLLYVSGRISRLLVKPVEDMIESEKNFISNASHELKTPLTIIMTNADLLAASIGNEKHLEYIKSEAKRMNHLISQMLTLAKLDYVSEFYDKSPFSLDEALLEVVYPFEGIAFEKSLSLSVDIENSILLNGDKQEIQKVAAILIENALDYSDGGGKVNVCAYRKNGKCIIQVSNHGKEIPKHIQNVLFERFYRQDGPQANCGSHFGLGLSIAYEIVKKHHGTITVSSNQGINCFTVMIPLQ